MSLQYCNTHCAVIVTRTYSCIAQDNLPKGAVVGAKQFTCKTIENYFIKHSSKGNGGTTKQPSRTLPDSCRPRKGPLAPYNSTHNSLHRGGPDLWFRFLPYRISLTPARHPFLTWNILVSAGIMHAAHVPGSTITSSGAAYLSSAATAVPPSSFASAVFAATAPIGAAPWKRGSSSSAVYPCGL